MPGSKREISSYFENMSLFMVGALFVIFPVFFLSTTTDAFVLPKQLVLIGLTSFALLFFAIKTIAEGKLKLRTSPFDLPVGLFLVVSLLSAIFSVNRYDSLIAFTPILFIMLLYFVIVNTAKSEKQLLFLLSSLTFGAALAALLAIFSFVKLYPLPFDYTHATSFTTFGSLLDQALYFALVLPIAGYFGYSYINSQKQNAASSLAAAAEGRQLKKSSRKSLAVFGIAFFILATGLGLSVFMLMTSQKPLILPYDTGLQTAFAAISQSTNVFKSLLLGSGFGTYLNDFTQFKPASFNANSTLWAFTFFRSSSFALELMATTGLLGLATFGFLIYRIARQKNFFLPLILAVVAALLLPFSFTLIALFFILLALFAIVCIHNNPNRFGEAELSLVAFKRGLLSLTPEHERAGQGTSERKFSRILPVLFMLIVLAILAVPLIPVTRFVQSDLLFQRSLVAASQNNGIQTYELQGEAIKIFPYRDIYYRSFSQTNLALANALAVNEQQKKKDKPDETTQKNILQLIQQSINAGRTAATVSPMTSFNWNNLSSIYRSLIGFGQNADKFTLLTLNQAIALDPNNPQQYVDLGGVYYQLGKFDDAIRQFQIAINLKQDYANAYYNLGHALEEKGEYEQAKAAYETVKTLVAGNDENYKKISSDMEALAKRKAGQKQAVAGEATAPAQATSDAQKAIDVNKSETQLPERNPQEEIPAPTIPPVAATPTTAETPIETPIPTP